MQKTYHLQRSAYHTAQDIAIPQLILRPPIIRQLHKLRQRILLKHQGKRLRLPFHTLPVRHRRRHIQEDLEPNFTDDLRRLAERTACPRVGFGEEILDQAEADVISHAVEFGVDGDVVGFIGRVWQSEVAAELGDDGAVGEGDDFGIDLVYASSEHTGSDMHGSG